MRVGTTKYSGNNVYATLTVRPNILAANSRSGFKYILGRY